jgi:hypothetical protein
MYSEQPIKKTIVAPQITSTFAAAKMRILCTTSHDAANPLCLNLSLYLCRFTFTNLSKRKQCTGALNVVSISLSLFQRCYCNDGGRHRIPNSKLSPALSHFTKGVRTRRSSGFSSSSSSSSNVHQTVVSRSPQLTRTKRLMIW